MLNTEIRDIIAASKERGWVLEPEAKRLCSLAGLTVPRFAVATKAEEATQFVQNIGYPIVAKVVSTQVLHKSDVGGVVVGIDSDEKLGEAFHRLSQITGFTGMLVEEMVSGIELIAGAKIDYQFGPVILLGLGGTGVEVYRDVTMRMAPLKPKDVASMVRALKAHQVLEGYRGSKPINMTELTRTMVAFSELVLDLEELIESIDLNPITCSSNRCVVTDARIMLTTEKAQYTPGITA